MSRVLSGFPLRAHGISRRLRGGALLRACALGAPRTCLLACASPVEGARLGVRRGGRGRGALWFVSVVCACAWWFGVFRRVVCVSCVLFCCGLRVASSLIAAWYAAWLCGLSEGRGCEERAVGCVAMVVCLFVVCCVVFVCCFCAPHPQMCGGCGLRSVAGCLVWCVSGLSRAWVWHK